MSEILEISQTILLAGVLYSLWRKSPESEIIHRQQVRRTPPASVGMCTKIVFTYPDRKENRRERFHLGAACPEKNTTKTADVLVMERPGVKYSVNNHEIMSSAGGGQ